MPLLRRLVVVGIPVLVVLALIISFVWYLSMRGEAKLATSAPEIPAGLDVASTPPAGGEATGDSTATAAADTPAAAPVSGQAYQIVSDQSEAAYFVGEKLASLSLPSTARGTTAIEGQFGIDDDSLPAGTSFTVDLRGLKSDESRRDQRVQDALQTSQYPEATFVVEGVTGVPNPVPEGEEFDLQLSGKFTLHGVTKDVVWDVKAKKQGNAVSALATLEITFSDYNINKPNIAGFVSVEDNATIQVQVVATAA